MTQINGTSFNAKYYVSNIFNIIDHYTFTEKYFHYLNLKKLTSNCCIKK